MTPEKWSAVRALFEEASDRPPAEREAFLTSACAGDADLKREVETLLRSDSEAAEFLEKPAAEAVHAATDGREIVSRRRVGVYEIIREIGRGGMGAVYLGSRADSEYRREVAIKILPFGLDSDFSVERFRNERQILAGLQHPCIASLYDGGTTEDGLPYFVMEYVKGEDVLSYCDRRKLTIAARIQLFRRICSAVHYAHQNLVVHRDIKPGNILVSEEGDPKLLDFGIAKLLDPQASPSGLTGVSSRIMTPGYASPEQVRGERITTASDVYSLGVLLYALLTGRQPYVVSATSPDAIIRSVCETEPLRPSLAVVRQEEGSASAAEARSTTPRGLRRTLNGDLDNILLAALRKEPQRRYQSVEQLSEDIRRYLAGLPVNTRPDTLRYRAGKYLTRHKALFAAGSLVTASLIGGLITTSWQARVARRERQRAEHRFDDVRKLATAFLFEFHDAIADLEGATAARALVVRKAIEYLDSLAAEAGDDMSLQRELAKAYFKVAVIQVETGTGAVDESETILASFKKALAVLERVVGSDSKSMDDVAELADLLGWISSYQSRQGRYAEGIQYGLRSLSLSEQVVAARPDNKEASHIMAAVYQDLSYAYAQAGDAKSAEAMARKELSLFESLSKKYPSDASLTAGVAFGHRMVGVALRELGRTAEAVIHHEAAIEIDKRLAASDPTNPHIARRMSLGHSYAAQCLNEIGELDRAYVHVRAVLTLREAMAASDESGSRLKLLVADSRCLLAQILAGMGRGQESVREASVALEWMESESKRDQGNTELQEGLADAYYSMAIATGAVHRPEKSVAGGTESS